MKKSTFGLIAATAMLLTPLAALAQDSQQNLQLNDSAAGAVGVGNLINQQTYQRSNQTQLDIDGYRGYGVPSHQTSVQDNGSAAAAVGRHNLVNQGVVQDNDQFNGNVDTYPAYYPAHY